MKRFWIGVALLVGILLVGLWTTNQLGKLHTATASDLTGAAQAAQQGQWEQADRHAAAARQRWQQGWHFSAALADHTVLDEIDGLFAQSEIYRKNRDAMEYAAICARLAQHVTALQESHQLSWWNLL